MSSLKLPLSSESGFTIVEVIVTLLLVSIVTTIMITFSNTSVSQYLGLQQDGVAFGDVATQTQRVATVLRGLTDISTATGSDLSIYAYFFPSDTYVSQVHYYKSADNTKLLADVTPMTANPPNGTLITSSKKTYTVIDNLFNGSTATIFTYLDASGSALSLPIDDLHTIKGIRVTLAVPTKAPSANGSFTSSLQVTLRNRKTNL